MTFTKGTPKPANGGRKRGTRNRRTIAAAGRPDALEHLEKVMTATAETDPLILPDMKLRAAIALAHFQHSKPAPTRIETFIGPIDYTKPATVEEARAALLELGERLARREISVEAHDALVGGLRAYLGDKAAEQERILARLEASLRGGDT